MTPPEATRIRVRYSVRGKVRFLSHRDVARVLERAIRRAGVPVAYSQGFSPRPKIQYGLALSTGYESDAEFVDLDLDPQRPGVRDPQEIAVALGACMPKGLDVVAAADVASGEPSLQDSVTSTSWVAWIRADDIDPATLRRRVGQTLDAPTHEIEIVRKGKQVREDLRPLLLQLAVVTPTAGEPIADTVLTAELGTKPRSVRPAELMETLGITEPLLVRRTHQWTRRDGCRAEPLGLEAPSPRTEVCAS